MAYFIPSYFQKRLLRYALTRLDFIDSDELDLDNLGLTWGQRTVVELKNVGIKVRKLEDLLQLPSTFLLSHASIKLLRLTLPADLHISGIEIEVDGVEVIVAIRPGHTKDTALFKETSLPSKTDRANLPRIVSSSIHNPGGRGTRSRSGRSLEFSQVVPTSEDLAASFLESEPPRERDELQAALESRSQFLQESISPTATDDVGLGMPGGLSLPSFVANFFKGVADRLSVKVKDINVVLEMNSSGDGVSSSEKTKFMLTVGDLSVDALATAESLETQTQSSRSIRIEDVQVFILSDSEAFSDSSGLNSPKLARSRLRLSHPESHSDVSRPSHSRNNDFEHSSDGSRLPSPSFSNSGLGIGLAANMLEDSTIFSAGLADEEPHQSSYSDKHLIDNREHAEQVHDSHNQGNFPGPTPDQPSSSENLAESRIFTHDEAESMYLSAVSGQNMPGGWAWSSPSQTQDINDLDLSSTEPHPDPTQPIVDLSSQPGSDRSLSGSEGMQVNEDEEVSNGESVLNNNLASFFRSRLIHMTYIVLTIPEMDDHQVQTPSQERGSSLRPLATPRTSQIIRPCGDEVRASFYTPAGALGKALRAPVLEVGEISIDLDVMVCKVAVKTAQTLVEAFPATVKQPQSSTTASKPLPSVTIHKLNLHLCECVPRLAPTKLPFQTLESALPDGQALLKLSLSPIVFLPPKDLGVASRFTVSKIMMTHGPRVVLSFVDSINVRDSIATSSMLRPHDFVASMASNRYDVQIKPAHIVLDLLVIDEVLSRSGGLSSLLDLGNSIMSTNTVKSPTVVSPSDTTRQRTVRFDDPKNRSRTDSNSTSSLPKVDVRVSGSVLDLIGSESSVQVRTSALKAVYRESNIKLAIDGAAIEGPLLEGIRSRGETWVKIRNIQAHYSDTPDDNDLDRLLSLITPSRDKYDQEDDIMVDTLIRQRRKGGVLRLTVGDLQAGATGFHWVPHLAKVADEISKLSSVTKYLPEDDRPGVLMFGLVNKLDFRLDVDQQFGPLRLKAELIELSNISVPSLAAAQIASWSLSRGDNDVLIGEVTAQGNAVMGPPMIMCRFIADEMEPTVRMKMSNTCFEYKVPTLMAVTSLLERLQVQQPIPQQHSHQHPFSPSSSGTVDMAGVSRKVRFSLTFRDSAIALNPAQGIAKGLFVLTDTIIRHESEKHGSIENLEIRKASFLVINDRESVGRDTGNVDHKLYFEENDQIQSLTRAGFVPVGSISSASAIVNVIEDKVNHETRLEVEFRNNLLFLETCADSTQTLIQILSGLAPPIPPSKVAKYRTEIIPIQDMLSSFTGNAFVSEPGPALGLQASQQILKGRNFREQEYEHEFNEDEDDDDSEEGRFMDNMYREDDDADDEMTLSHVESNLGHSTMSESIHIAPVDVMASSTNDLGQSVMAHSLLDFRQDHFAPKSSVGGTAHRWNSTQNTYGLVSDTLFDRSPLKVRVRDVHVIWNLFDGYDWQTTRDTISQAVKDIETRAMARRPKSTSRLSAGAEEEDESVIGDFLFNSIYIGIPANKDPRDLTTAINHDIDDMVSETGSYATSTTITATTSRRQSSTVSRPKKLRLNRSKHHKMTFELAGVSSDFVMFPSESGEVESSIDIRVKMLEVFDHVPTSTWKKFATYMQDAGEREVGTNMVHIEILNVKPVPDLAASEIVLKLTVLPLRLHVDQDALDFLTRFFEFKDDSAPPASGPSTPPFIQRVEVNPVQLRLDFKPKRVDYGGLRSGRTTEFMNFFVLDRADIVLRRVILYGVSGFDRMGIMLNNIWTPDVKTNQLPGVLAGLAPIRPLVDVTSGVRDLIAVPIREYRKDGRLVRSIQKGALAFAKTTATELVNLGAKLAIGTQQVLQNTEDLLITRETQENTGGDDETKNQISLYADQPLGIVQGLRGAYTSLERDLLLARDAIVAVPGEVLASGSATGAAKAVLKQSPTIILRPAIGATKAVGQTLLGAGNTLDKRNLRRMDEENQKYKRH
ncbi:uncharacterized protein A1O9_06730 [Exophiala aquamarina CBS 119918]|uniref:Autophagy-related protein 2 n=1 Tax=Exophiala aquamarina CBS 119918 TaxID=1182545 RepID=A0A072P9U8_9EURO|nr:uncharacterized protein A1O9_06730 [Exophiala aquamarina CBS 119918]KEF56542.1 hypothetical protein A1O9_06730 [Exophiala aquamarina CBS 119918]